MDNIKFMISRLLFNLQLHAGKFRLLGYAVLLDALLAIGDITVYLALPELFIGILLTSILMVVVRRYGPVLYLIILKRRALLTTVLTVYSCIIFMHYFIWIAPY